MKMVKNNSDENTHGLLGKGVEITGDILFTERLQVEGKVVGKLVSESGTLIIEETGRVEAQVDVGVCIIRGTLEGNVKAKSRIEVRKASRVRGDLTTPVLLVEEGALFNGTIGMGAELSNRLPDALRSKDSDDKIKVKGA